MDHIHRYRRKNIGHDKEFWVMQCDKPNCTHYTPMASKLSCPLLRNKMAECPRCEENFILDRRALRMESPCCEDCVKRRKSKADIEAENFFKKLEEGIKV